MSALIDEIVAEYFPENHHFPLSCRPMNKVQFREALQRAAEGKAHESVALGEPIAPVEPASAYEAVMKLVDELLTAKDRAAVDVGGSRPINKIISELGPVWQKANDAAGNEGG